MTVIYTLTSTASASGGVQGRVARLIVPEQLFDLRVARLHLRSYHSIIGHSGLDDCC